MTQRLTSPTRDGLRFLTIADLSRGDFANSQIFSAFSRWADYEDFQFERECLALSYDSAGVRAHRQLVSLETFAGWSRLTGSPLDIDGLDEFAAHWRFRVRRPGAVVRGRFGEPGRPEHNAVEVSGAQSVVVREAVYARWRDEFAAGAPFHAPDVDAYAAQVVACCLSRCVRARRSASKFV